MKTMSDPYIIDQQNFQYLNCKTSCYIDYNCSVNFHFTLGLVIIIIIVVVFCNQTTFSIRLSCASADV